MSVIKKKSKSNLAELNIETLTNEQKDQVKGGNSDSQDFVITKIQP